MPKFERDIEIDAPVEKVWEKLTDTNHWAEWFPGIDSVTHADAFEPGGTVEWTRGGQTGRAKIVSIEPMKRLEIMTQIGDDKDSHVFTLKPSGGFLGMQADETKVEYSLDTLIGGGLLGSFVAGGNPVDALKVKKTVHLLRKMVEKI
jgi:uncharacterized protein YndB with AHSA1/START domain